MTDKEYWDRAGADPLVDMKYICDANLNDCLDAIIPYIKPKRILEIGCGVGRLTYSLASSDTLRDCSIHGIDISPRMLDIAAERRPKIDIEYKICNGKKIPRFKCHDKFDSIYSMLTFQHIDKDSIQSYLKESFRLLVIDGIIRFQYVEGDYHAPQDHNYSCDDMSSWLNDAGFSIKNIQRGLVHHQWTWITATKIDRRRK